MNFFYDFHLHSCLSPCGDEEMTPFNLVNLAKLQGFDIIALTDHNTCLNCPAAIKAGAEAGIAVIPGMELCTAEEIHAVCLFPDLDSALSFSDEIHKHIPNIKNRPEIFGEQQIRDKNDNIIGYEPLLLTTATDISIDEVDKTVNDFGGAWFPAHLDRASYSVISSLGAVPDNLKLHAAEFTEKADINEYLKSYPGLKDIPIFIDSDAHYLEDIPQAKREIELEECTARCLVEQIKRGYLL